MRRIRVFLLSLLLVGLVLSAAGTPQASARGPGISTELLPGQARIHGKIERLEGQRADGDALIRAFASEAAPDAEPIAESLAYGGTFDLPVPAGDYRIEFIDLDDHYPTFFYGGADGAQVTVADQQELDLGTQRFDLPRGSGQVTVPVEAADGTPLSAAELTLYVVERERDDDGTVLSSYAYPLDLSVTNAGSGDYTVDVSQLYEDTEYTVRAGSRGYDNAFLGGAPDGATADTFTVGDQGSTLDPIVLTSKPGVTGTVTDRDGPVSGVLVRLYRRLGTAPNQYWTRTDRTTRTDATGSYWLTKPPAGEYTLEFSRDSDLHGNRYSEKVYLGGVYSTYWSNPASFTVDDDAVEITQDVTFSGLPATGLITGADGQPLADAGVSAQIRENGHWAPFSAVSDATDEIGEFSVYLPRDAELRVYYSRRNYRQQRILHTFPAGTDDIALDPVALQPHWGPVWGDVAGEQHEYCLAETVQEGMDDGSSGQVSLPFDVDLHGQTYDELWVNANGNLSFEGPLREYTPRDLSTALTRPVIAPYWADATTEWPGWVTYGVSPDGEQFCAVWNRVPYSAPGRARLQNTFQVILTSRDGDPGRAAGDVDIRFNYDQVRWESGYSSGGVDGLGGRSAAVGYSAGTGDSGTWLELDGSRVNGALLDGSPTALITGSRSSAQPGRYEIEVRNSTTLQDGEADQAVTGGETVTTQGEATPDSPVQTSIGVPAGVSGWLSVSPQPAEGAPSGFTLFGTELDISAPSSTFDNPYVAGFTIDESLLTAAGISVGDVQVFRNGAAVADCTHLLYAVPDPCVVSRALDGEGDAVITVRTSAFSTWGFGAVDYDLTGPLAPVDPNPTQNVAKAGSTIPVKFRLGGDRGMAVFSDGYPEVRSVACSAGASDAVEQTVAASSSRLVFDHATGTYSYLWKTDKGRTGCYELVLRFKDGSQLAPLFKLR